MYPRHLNHTNQKPNKIGVVGIDDAAIAIALALKAMFSFLLDFGWDSKQMKEWKKFLEGKDAVIIYLIFNFYLYLELVEYLEDKGEYTQDRRKGLSFLFYNIQYSITHFPAITTSEFQSKYGISFLDYISTGIVPSKDIEATSYILLRPIYFPGIGYQQPGVDINPKKLVIDSDYDLYYHAITDFRYPDAVWYSRTVYNQDLKLWQPSGNPFTTEAAAVNDIAQQIYDFRMKNDPEFVKAQANKPAVIYSDRNAPVNPLLVTNRPGSDGLSITNKPGAIRAMTQNGAIELLNDTPQALPQKVTQGQVYNAAPAKQTSNPLGWILGISMLGFLITKAD